MQSSEKKEGRGAKKPNNPRNSFVPQDTPPSNEFLSHNSRVSQKPSSKHSPPNSKSNEESPRIKRPSRQSSIESPRQLKNDMLRARNNQKMQVIHEENINVKTNTPPPPRIKKNTFQLNEVNQERRQPSPRREVYKQRFKETQSQVLEQESVPEEKKMKDLNAGMQKLSESILDLKSKYNELEQQQAKHQVKIEHRNKSIPLHKSKQMIKNEIFGEKSPEQLERQYKQFLKNKNKEKMARKKVLEQIAEKEKQKLEQYKKERQQMKESEKKQRIKEIRQQRSKVIEKNKRSKQMFNDRRQAIQQFVKKFEGHQYFAIKKQKQDQEKKKQVLQQQKQYLFDRKQMFKPIDFQQIDEHEKWYLQKIQQLTNQKRELKNEEWTKIEQQNAEFPQFYKGKAHNIALQERLQKVRRRKQPKEKVKRINEYKAYVREHFVPRTHENRSLQNSQIRNDSSLTHRQIKRFRYYKGVSYGQIIQARPIAKSTQEVRRMGIHNLQFMKKLPKGRSSPKIEAYELKLMEHNRSRVKKQEHFLPEQDKIAKNKKIVLPDSVKSDELKMVMKRLRSHDEKLKHKQYALSSQPQVLNEYIDQKKINEELIDNIQRKLSLLAQL